MGKGITMLFARSSTHSGPLKITASVTLRSIVTIHTVRPREKSSTVAVVQIL